MAAKGHEEIVSSLELHVSDDRILLGASTHARRARFLSSFAPRCLEALSVFQLLPQLLYLEVLLLQLRGELPCCKH